MKVYVLSGISNTWGTDSCAHSIYAAFLSKSECLKYFEKNRKEFGWGTDFVISVGEIGSEDFEDFEEDEWDKIDAE